MAQQKNNTSFLTRYLSVVVFVSYVTGFITYLSSLLFGSDVTLSHKILDHPLLSMGISTLNKIFYVDYTLMLLFLIYFFLILAAKTIHRLAKKALMRYVFLFWLFATLVCGYAINMACVRVARFPLPVLFTIDFIVLSVVGIAYHCMNDHCARKIAVVCSGASLVLAGVFVAVLNYIDICVVSFARLVAYPVIIALVSILGLGMFLCCESFAILFRFIDSTRAERRLHIALRVIAALVVVQLCIGGGGLFWENYALLRDSNAEMFQNIESHTQQDINVILITVDSLRSDHLGCYGYKRPVSPYLDSFAQTAVRFENCYAESSHTKPSTASLLSSLYPAIHGTRLKTHVLPDEVTTIAEILKQEGYVTYGYTANPNLKKIFNYNQGFDFFDDYLMKDKMYYVTLRTVPLFAQIIHMITKRSFACFERDTITLAQARIIPWLHRHKDHSFFMYLHYMDPHFPYTPPAPYSTMFPAVQNDDRSKAISMYDGEIRFFDDGIQRFFQELQSLGIYDKSLIIVTADHGEEFLEHGFWLHGLTLYQEQLRVPLIIKLPHDTRDKRVVNAPVRLIDIVPTILDVLGIKYELTGDGKSLLALAKGKDTKPTRETIYSSVRNFGNMFDLESIIEGNRWKYIYTNKSLRRNVKLLGHEELYDLTQDPHERANVIQANPAIAERLRQRLDQYRAYCKEREVVAQEKVLDYEMRQQLKALGYLQ